MSNEIWKTCVGYDGYEKYEVSNHARVRNTFNGKLVKPRYNKSTDTMRVQLYIKGVLEFVTLHRLVALAFLDTPEEKFVVTFKTDDKTNCRPENLEVISYKEKAVRRFKREKELGKWHKKRAKSFILENVQSHELVAFDSIKQASIELGVDRSSVSKVVNKVKHHYTVGGWKLHE